MKTFVGLFISSALFGIVIATIYWFTAHEESTGTILLGIMSAALVFAAGYAVVAERDAHLAGDSENKKSADVAGEDLGIFTIETPWPILAAFCALGLLLGIVWSPFLAAAALAGLLLCLWRLGAESART